MNQPDFKVADLCDDYAAQVHVADPLFRDFGQRPNFCGPIVTLKLFEDNSLVRAALSTPGQGRVLVVDGGGSTRCALVGDQLARLAADNGWAGLVVYGCIRDSVEIAGIPIGLKAIGTNPLKSVKKNVGERDLPLKFAGIIFQPGHYLYADPDGIIVSQQNLLTQA